MNLNDLIQTIPELTELPPLVWMIEGSPKTGKTTQALTWPDPLLLDFPAEQGATFHPGTQRILVDEWKRIEDVSRALRVEKRFATVILDTADAAWDLLTRGRKLELQEYGGMYQSYLQAIRSLLETGRHVVLVSHVKQVMEEGRDERGKKSRKLLGVKTALPGQLAGKVAGMCDHLLHALVSDDGAFGVQCQPGKLREAGGRLRELPAFVKLQPGERLFDAVSQAFQKARGQAPARPAPKLDQMIERPRPAPKPQPKPVEKPVEKDEPRSQLATDAQRERLELACERGGMKPAELRQYIEWNVPGATLETLTSDQAQEMASILEEPELISAQLEMIRGIQGQLAAPLTPPPVEAPKTETPAAPPEARPPTKPNGRRALMDRIRKAAGEAGVVTADLVHAASHIGGQRYEMCGNAPVEILERIEALLSTEEGIVQLVEHIEQGRAV